MPFHVLMLPFIRYNHEIFNMATDELSVIFMLTGNISGQNINHSNIFQNSAEKSIANRKMAFTVVADARSVSDSGNIMQH
jgi:hypothetical protein